MTPQKKNKLIVDVYIKFLEPNSFSQQTQIHYKEKVEMATVIQNEQ